MHIPKKKSYFEGRCRCPSTPLTNWNEISLFRLKILLIKVIFPEELSTLLIFNRQDLATNSKLDERRASQYWIKIIDMRLLILSELGFSKVDKSDVVKWAIYGCGMLIIVIFYVIMWDYSPVSCRTDAICHQCMLPHEEQWTWAAPTRVERRPSCGIQNTLSATRQPMGSTTFRSSTKMGKSIGLQDINPIHFLKFVSRRAISKYLTTRQLDLILALHSCFRLILALCFLMKWWQSACAPSLAHICLQALVNNELCIYAQAR